MMRLGVRSARVLAAVLTIGMLTAEPSYAAGNPMGYTLISASDAANLPRNGGSLGMDIERAEQINDDGMSFDLVRIKSVRRGAAAAQVGLKAGDEIVAVDGHLFANLRTFAAYIGSLPPGRQVTVDLIPPGGGPQQAQRVAVSLGAASNSGQVPEGASAEQHGMSTGTKVAIGLGLLFGCYELGCFSHPATKPPAQ